MNSTWFTGRICHIRSTWPTGRILSYEQYLARGQDLSYEKYLVHGPDWSYEEYFAHGPDLSYDQYLARGPDLSCNVTEKTTGQFIQQNWLVSDKLRELVQLFLGLSLSTVIAVFGIVGNIVNVVIFYNQGLNTSINISFTFLAINDIGSLVTLLWVSLCDNPLFISSGIPFSFSEVQHISASFPHACLSRVTSWITVYILMERCASVMFPFKVKYIITPVRTVVTIILIYIVMIVSLVPEYSTAYLGWRFNLYTNRTILGLVFTSDRAQFKGVSLSLYGAYMLASFVAVPTLTCALAIVYVRSARWRHSNTRQSISASGRDKKAVKMVLVVGLVFTVSYSFSVVLVAIGKSVPGFDVVGVYANLFIICFAVSFVLDAVNSSIHVIIYYKTLSKYRKSFQQLFDQYFLYFEKFTSENSAF
ncbi:hypothetical protein Btru_065496 [Bulinus truncatus]|nr:hypothetical protein Btru_065496 [Bulinus truncatus]